MDITDIFNGIKSTNPEGSRFGEDNFSYIWWTNGLGQYSFNHYGKNKGEDTLCIIKEFDSNFYLEKSLIFGKVVIYGNEEKVIEPKVDQKFVFKSFDP